MKKSLLLIGMLGCIINASAQDLETVKKDRYTLNIINKNDQLKDDLKKDLTDAFFNAYPAFARADGYRTKREVNMEISNDYKGTVSASAGTIQINRKWLKKNPKHLESVLQYQLSRNWVSADTIKKDGYSLVFISKDPNLDLNVKKNLIDTYFKIYPVLVAKFNDKSTRDVLFVVDTAYKAVAEASGGRVLFSAGYMKAHPTDIDVVTHETMHIVQGYGYSAGPVWLTEGIADYVRFKYGVDNVGSKWSLPAFSDKQHYTNSYRITARFFEWIDKTQKAGIVDELDKSLRAHTYNDGSWKALTGKTIDELWAAYAANPVI
ncbi:basic secretory protein-like protein [Pedobacter metabolipauper]|uniref:Basic secretory peptidase family protein n=1 Tax=Pedobacter metabolipauper TaxID=425513 RepID=A0A4V3D1B9_9SPHI|nr:basic secretory protein-like protein [Pedobacter metabolipauper]TDQ10047.1 basic secretory peptidase family protein [Pedobacter metabolipauper]